MLENKTGRILAMAGSFSYPLSQLNRTWQTQRQPGSAIKPITYLTALQKGLQPNTLVPNDPITLPPIGSASYGSIARDYNGTDRPEDYWSPRNADYASGGVFTMRRGLENSINVVTAHLLDGGIDADPVASLDEVCATAKAAKIYTDCVRYYPFVLGAQPVRMIDLAAFYAAVANEGARPQPHAIDAIEANGQAIYEYPKVPLFSPISAADGVSFYQLKTMLQGVVARGTARAIGGLSPYVAGKTGTTEDAVDGWFVGFTNDVTVAVWVGYDNGDGKRRSLGSNATGARVALPIFKPIIEAIWAEHIAPKAPLAGPSREVQRLLVDVPIDYTSGTSSERPREQRQQQFRPRRPVRRLRRQRPAAGAAARRRSSSSTSGAMPTASPKTRNIRSSRARTPTPCAPTRQRPRQRPRFVLCRSGRLRQRRPLDYRADLLSQSGLEAGAAATAAAAAGGARTIPALGRLAGNNPRRNEARILSGADATTDPAPKPIRETDFQ